MLSEESAGPRAEVAGFFLSLARTSARTHAAHMRALERRLFLTSSAF